MTAFYRAHLWVNALPHLWRQYWKEMLVWTVACHVSGALLACLGYWLATLAAPGP